MNKSLYVAAAVCLLQLISTCCNAASVVNYKAPELVSANGLLNITISIDNVWSLNGKRYAPAYNGGPVGPTIRLKPGDTFIVTVKNNLPPESAYAKQLKKYIEDPASNLSNVTIIENRLSAIGEYHKSQFGYWGQNFMNIHFHGARRESTVEDLGFSLDGGESRTYTHKIKADQPPGLAWYHNHHHGTTVYSYLSGLLGAVVIEGTQYDLTAYPEVAAAKEHILILAESLVDPKTSRPRDWVPMAGEFGWDHVTNGHLGDETVYQFNTGETAFFRLISATVEQNIVFSIDGHLIRALAYDGYPITAPLQQVQNLTIDSGSRVEFMVKFDTPGTYKFRRAAWNRGEKDALTCQALYGIAEPNCVTWDRERLIATIVVVDGPAVSGKNLPVGLASSFHPSLASMASRPVVGTRYVSFSEAYDFPLFQIPYGGSYQPGKGYGMNNKFYDSRTISGKIEAGTCEKWVVISSPTAEHPFHVHQTPFLVTKVGGVTLKTPFWRDTLAIKTLDIEIKLCFPETPGKLMVHCHMASHLDVGMAATYEITPSTSISTPAPVTFAPTKVPTIRSSSLAPSTATTPPFKICFSGETSVVVKDKGTMLMKDLQLGDKILVGEADKYETVYSFGHRHETVEATFLQFLPSNLEMSRDHMLKINGRYVPASAVQVGDELETATGELIAVSSIKNVVRPGAYAPFTLSGTIIVNNVKASAYIAFQDSDRLLVGGWSTPITYQWLAHASQGPHRLWVHLFGVTLEEEYSDEGLSSWIEAPHQIGELFLEQNPIIMMILLVPVVVCLLVVSVIEQILVWWM